MSDRITKQLYDDGSVIGYVPRLQYEKELNGSADAVTGQNQSRYIPGTDLTIYSSTLNGFGQNKPSDAMKAIDYAVNNMEKLLDRLVDKFVDERDSGNNPFASKTGASSKNSKSNSSDDDITGNKSSILNNNSNNKSNPSNSRWPVYNDPYAFRDALDNGDNDYVNDFVDYHRGIDGSQIPELMQQIHNSEDNLNNLKDTIGKIYYGNDNMPTDDAVSIDQGYIDSLRRAEKSNNSSIINYPMIAYDAIFSKSVQLHAYRDNKQAINVANAIVKRDKGTATANDMNIIKTMYDEVNHQLDLRANSYNKNQTIELMQKALYNYYETRKYLNDLFKLRHEGTSNESVFIGRKIQEYSERTTEALRNVNRVFKLDQLNLKKIYELEKEKYFIKSLYGSTSSNL